jgi:large subunit ribosomal protein L9
MKIILLDKIIRLGDIGDVVNVKSGFARNYLIPQKKAMFANDENIKIVEAKKAELAAESEDLESPSSSISRCCFWKRSFNQSCCF